MRLLVFSAIVTLCGIGTTVALFLLSGS